MSSKRLIIGVIGLLLMGLMYVGTSEVRAQQGLVCPVTDNTTGWLRIPVRDATDMIDTDFTGALIATAENAGGAQIGGMDNLLDIGNSLFPGINTIQDDYQLISPWRMDNGNVTYLTVVNGPAQQGGDNMGPPPGTGSLHIHILDSNCVEIINFCDEYTDGDSHTYDFSNLVTDRGQAIGLDLTGMEGIVTITPATDCIENDTTLSPFTSQMVGDVNIVNSEVDLGTGVFGRDSFFIGTFSPGIFAAEYNTQSAQVAGDIYLLNIWDTTDPVTGDYIPAAGFATYGEIRDYDDDEQFVSCGQFDVCYARLGINASVPGTDELPDPDTTCNCGDADCPVSDPGGVICEDPEATCDDGDDNDGDNATDCADSDCDGVGICEFGGEVTCDDGEDNDGDNATDCADSDCDGVGICEFGEELSCNDGEDNDGDTLVDGDDSDCEGDGGDDSGGCTVAAGPVSTGTGLANFLLPLLALGAVFVLRRRQK